MKENRGLPSSDMLKVELFIYSLALITLRVIGDIDTRSIINQYGSNLCPYTDFCYTNASKTVPPHKDAVRCCPVCSCKEACWKQNNCCPDSEYYLRPPQTLPPCKNTLIKMRDDQDIDILRYHVIDDCPIDETNATLVQNCAAVDESILENKIWVSDKTSGQIFANKYCALCHGIADVIAWNARALCKRLKDLPQILGNPFTDTCDLINEVPDKLRPITGKYRCYISEISSCNTTGEWDNYIEEIETACNTFESQFIRHTVLLTEVNRNIFCAICNRKADTMSHMMCPPYTDQEPERGTVTPFTALFNFETIHQLQDEHSISQRRCPVDEILDEFMLFCRKLFCPLGSVAYYGRCEKRAEEIIGVGLEMGFDMDLIESQSNVQLSRLYDGDSVEVRQKIFKKLQKVLGIDKAQCRNMETILYVRQLDVDSNIVVNDLHLTFYVCTTTTCQLDLLLNTATNLNKQMRISISNSESMSLNITMVQPHSSNALKNFSRTIFAKQYGYCFPRYTLERTMACPSISVELWETGNLHNEIDIKRFKQLFGNETSENASVKRICLDEYRAALAKVHVNDATSIMIKHLEIVIVLSLLLLSAANL